MQMTRSDADPALDSVSSSIWHALFGTQSNQQLLKVQFFGTEIFAMKQTMEVSRGL